MKCSVFIAVSADGKIATTNGDVEWLDMAGKRDVDMGEQSDMGFNKYLASVDCLMMGRKTMEKLSSYNLAPEQWPYGNIRIIALSNTIKKPPENLKYKMEMYSGNVPALLSRLESEGIKHIYVDGGTTITYFLNHELIDEMTITYAPMLLGDGIPLIDKLNVQIRLEDPEITAYENDFIQIIYKVSYS